MATDGCLPEADQDIGAASQAVITEMVYVHKEPWLGLINRHNKVVPRLRPWYTDIAYMCSSSFIIPAFDRELDDLMRNREQAEYTGTRDDAVRLRAIYARVAELGGEILIWT
jgi:hypothetical protein